MSRHIARTAVAVNAKRPQAGRVKTRLCPPLTPEQAAELYEAFLLDLAGRLEALASADLVMFHDPPDAQEWFRWRLGSRWEFAPQSGSDLGVRLEAEAEWLGQHGYSGFVLLGSDAPTLPLQAVRTALDRILDAPGRMVLGPDQDGGYYLVALRAPVPGLFTDVAWSGPNTLPDTARNARLAGLEVLMIDPWYDVDTGSDLARLRTELEDGAAAAQVPRTARWLKRHPSVHGSHH